MYSGDTLGETFESRELGVFGEGTGDYVCLVRIDAHDGR
jgi:hypothetical protein